MGGRDHRRRRSHRLNAAQARRLVGSACVFAALGYPAGGVSTAAAAASLSMPGNLSIAELGVKQASAWANHQFHWYNQVLHDQKKDPQANFVDADPLFEAIDYIALASPTTANKHALVRFANHAETYWDTNITPAPGASHRTAAWAPYPGSKQNVLTYFDANGWWSLAFMDAYSATKSARYLKDAERGFKFIAANGWDAAGGGMWRDTKHTARDGDSLAAATDLAARLYQTTGRSNYLVAAEQWITWADAHLLKSNGTYAAAIPHSLIMPHDGEGAMLAAFTALCEKGTKAPLKIGTWCARAESFAATTLSPTNAFFPLKAGPQIDSVYLRDLLTLYGHDHKARWYNAVANAAAGIYKKARKPNGLFLKAWDGSSAVLASAPNMLRTHAASVSVFASLAAAPAPA
jgi:hypothetical protein